MCFLPIAITPAPRRPQWSRGRFAVDRGPRPHGTRQPAFLGRPGSTLTLVTTSASASPCRCGCVAMRSSALDKSSRACVAEIEDDSASATCRPRIIQPPIANLRGDWRKPSQHLRVPCSSSFSSYFFSAAGAGAPPHPEPQAHPELRRARTAAPAAALDPRSEFGNARRREFTELVPGPCLGHEHRQELAPVVDRGISRHVGMMVERRDQVLMTFLASAPAYRSLGHQVMIHEGALLDLNVPWLRLLSPALDDHATVLFFWRVLSPSELAQGERDGDHRTTGLATTIG